MPDELKTWQDIEKEIIPIISSTISLMEEILDSVVTNYMKNKRLYLFRTLCYGFLCVAHNNMAATLKLIESNLVDQINYISRNSLEMLIILHYIDNNDPKTRDSLTERFFHYSNVVAYRAMKVMDEYPDIFKNIRTKNNDLAIEMEFEHFKTNYYCKNIRDTYTWSGKTLNQMIGSLSNSESRALLLLAYKSLLVSNNNFLHPSYSSLRHSIIQHHKQEVDYKKRVNQLESVHWSTRSIMEKVLEQFSKGRISFRHKLQDIIMEKRYIKEKSTHLYLDECGP